MLTHHELRLANGLPVVLVPMPGVHRAVATLYLRVGSRFESPEDNGISHFLEHMIFRGSPSLASAHDQALAFERLGATPYAATHVDHGVMSVSVPPVNLERVLALLAEVTVAPRFSDIEVERGIVREEIWKTSTTTAATSTPTTSPAPSSTPTTRSATRSPAA